MNHAASFLRSFLVVQMVFLFSLCSFGHPVFPLLDSDQVNVLKSGQPVSTNKTCGVCHDTEYISSHFYHASLGFDERYPLGKEGRVWDWSPGPLGRWSSLSYDYLVPETNKEALSSWVKKMGRIHVGGGPTPTEVNCFLCHIPHPANEARILELENDRYSWAATATLEHTGIVSPGETDWKYVKKHFSPYGEIDPEILKIQDPQSENCGLCHDLTHFSHEALLLDISEKNWFKKIKGQVFSPRRIVESALNLKGKEKLYRPWDIHAERLLGCVNCHFSPNNPVYYLPDPKNVPEHLGFEARRPRLYEYFKRPDHNFAKGNTTQGSLAHASRNSMRKCKDCHKAESSHSWLPYARTHFNSLSCEACHISQVYYPAIQMVDWTMLDSDGSALKEWRGVDGEVLEPSSWVRGFKPAFILSRKSDGKELLTPHNLIASWFWIGGEGGKETPVSKIQLEEALLNKNQYRNELIKHFDSDDNGVLEKSELYLNTEKKIQFVKQRLQSVGIINPRISSEVQPYSLHHGVGSGKWALKDCTACHNKKSRFSEPFELSSYVPGNVIPQWVADSGMSAGGGFMMTQSKGLVFDPSDQLENKYVIGHSRKAWVDILGMVLLLGVILASAFHAIFRLLTLRKKRNF